MQFLSIFRLMSLTVKQGGWNSVGQDQCWQECGGWWVLVGRAHCARCGPSHIMSQSLSRTTPDCQQMMFCSMNRAVSFVICLLLQLMKSQVTRLITAIISLGIVY